MEPEKSVGNQTVTEPEKDNLVESVTSPEVPAVESSEASTENTTPSDSPELSEQPASESNAPKGPRKKLLWAMVGLFLVANLGLAAGNVYAFTRHETNAPGTTKAVVAVVAVSEKKPTTKTVASAPSPKTLHYLSKELGIEFDYPVDWRVSSDSANAYINLTSSPFSFTDPRGVSKAVNIKLAISPTDSQGDAFTPLYDGQQIAADSEALDYTNPAPGQRTQTHISFTGETTGEYKGIDAGFISGKYIYKPGSTIDSQPYTQVNPQISFYIDPCGNEQCMGFNNIRFTLNDWHNNTNMQQVKSLLASLRLM